MENNTFLMKAIQEIRSKARGVVSVVGAIQRNTDYGKGAVVFFADNGILYLDWLLECTTGGTTCGRDITLDMLAEGNIIQDGSVTWLVKRMSLKDIGGGGESEQGGGSGSDLIEENYCDTFNVPEGQYRSVFKLTHKPLGKIRVYVDGIRYFDGCITFDAKKNEATWVNDSSQPEGFDITDADVVFEYDYKL